MPTIVTENLTRRCGKFTAVDRVNFTVERGEVFGFLGPNGSGKTTVIKMLIGIAFGGSKSPGRMSMASTTRR